MTDSITNTIEYEAAVSLFIGAQMEGFIKIGNIGLEFQYRNKHLGKNLFFAWKDIREVQINISMLGKLGKEFSIETGTQTAVRFSSKQTGKIVKLISTHIDKKRIVRAPNLLSPFSMKK